MALPFTPDDLRTRYPEFTTVADAQVNALGEDAKLYISERALGNGYASGLLLMTCHLLKQALNPNGAAVSTRVGDLAESFMAQQVSNRSLMTTIYGRQLLWLLRTKGACLLTSATASPAPVPPGNWPPY